MALVISKGDAKSYLENEQRDLFGNKPWEKYRSSLSYQEQLANSEVNRQFGEAVGQAYDAAMQQRSAVLSSNLGQGYKEQELVGINQSIEEAYGSMLSQREASLQELSAGFDQAYAGIDEIVNTYAENAAEMSVQLNNYYDYLRENYADVLLNDAQWSSFWTDDYEVDENGNPIYDEEGNLKYILDEEGNRVKRLKTLDELDASGYEVDEYGNPVLDMYGNKQWLGLRDDQGNLTLKGIDFYDRMMNYFATHQGAENFEDYLRRENADLYDWMTSPNLYFQDLSGNNWGSFKSMVGLTSDDSTYSFIERFAGLTEGEVGKLFNDFNSRIDTMDEWGTTTLKDRPKKVREFVQDSMNNLKKFATDLGITEEELGFNWDTLDAAMINEINKQTSGGSMTGVFLGSTFGGAAAGLYAGALIGSPSPIAAPFTALIGSFLGFIGGIVGGSIYVSKAREQNKAVALQLKNQYKEAVAAMTTYAMQKRASVQAQYYNK